MSITLLPNKFKSDKSKSWPNNSVFLCPYINRRNGIVYNIYDFIIHSLKPHIVSGWRNPYP